MKKQLLLLVMILLPMVASSAAIKINGIYYDLSGKVAKVARNPNKYSGSVVIPQIVTYEGTEYNVTTIGQSAFGDCTGLTSITIPNSVTSIGSSAFYYCTGLTSITIPNSVTSIGSSAFDYCSGLTSVHISDIGAWCKISFGSLSNPLEEAHHLFLNGEEIKDLVIPNSVTKIGAYAFSGCSGLTSVTIPNSVRSIGLDTFRDCSGLTSITIPNSVTTIGEYAFYGCSGLTSVHISDIDAWCKISFGLSSNPLSRAHHLFLNGEEIKDLVIPNSVTSIGAYAFSGCSGLTSVTIPNSVTSIGISAFYGCSGLTSINIPSSVTSISESIFYGCTGLTSITIPNSVTSIGSEAFRKCSALTSITIPNSVTSIGSNAFRSCSSLTSITIPNSVTSIDFLAFSYCSALTDVYCYAEIVPNTKGNEDVFKNSNLDNATLHVPADLINSYKEANYWKNFKYIVAIEGETPATPKCETPTISYENGQLKMSCATEGAEFVTEIADADIKIHHGATISLTATYNISVYATKSGYENSDVVTATLCWIDQEPKTEGITDGVAKVPAKAVLIQSNGGSINVQGVDAGTPISVFCINGSQAGTAVSQNGEATINTTIPAGNVAIVKIGEKSVKVIMK